MDSMARTEEAEGHQRAEPHAGGLIGDWAYQQTWELEGRQMRQDHPPAGHSPGVHCR